MRYFHGTDRASYDNIMKHGFFTDKKTIWKCSDSDNIYLVSEDYDRDYYDGTLENLPAVRFAVEAGQIAAANANSQSTDVFVFEFDIDGNIELLSDSSCPNMDDCYEIGIEDLNKLISDNKVKIKIHCMHDAYEPNLRLFYLIGVFENTYYQCEDGRLLQVMQRFEKSVNDSCWFYDEYLGSFSSYTTMEFKSNDAYQFVLRVRRQLWTEKV